MLPTVVPINFALDMHQKNHRPKQIPVSAIPGTKLNKPIDSSYNWESPFTFQPYNQILYSLLFDQNILNQNIIKRFSPGY